MDQSQTDLFIEEDYKRLIKAVLDASLVDYIKLQHVKNRNKKFLQKSFLNSIDMFFDTTYLFEHFKDLETQTKNLNFLELLTCYLGKTIKDLDTIHKHISEESIAYWWEKNFHDLEIPETITIGGIVWTVKNSPNNSFIDHEIKRMYCPTSAVGADRTFYKLCFKQLCTAAEITIPEDSFDSIFKLFYLFLKINAPFNQRK
jgi:hypothetical protein